VHGALRRVRGRAYGRPSVPITALDLPGPSRRIRVEPLRIPDPTRREPAEPAPRTEPAPAAPPPVPEREPERVPA
jgi:hypothetical protein